MVSANVSRMKTPTDLLAMLCTFRKDYTYSYWLGSVHRSYKYTTDELTLARNLGQSTPKVRGLPVVIGAGEDMIDSTRVCGKQLIVLDVTTISLPAGGSGGQIYTQIGPLNFKVLPYSFTQSSCSMELKLS
jgi:hypothetical protein